MFVYSFYSCKQKCDWCVVGIYIVVQGITSYSGFPPPRKFNKTIEILQADYDELENEKMALERQLSQHSKKGLLGDVTVGRRTLGGRGSPYSSPFAGRKVLVREDSEGGEGGEGAAQVLQTPLLLAKVSA